MTSFQYRMPAGIPGEINRIWSSIIETQVLTPFGTTGAPTAYGVPLIIDATGGNVGNVRTMAVADYSNATYVSGGVLQPIAYGVFPYGILARPYPTGNSQDPVGTSTPPTSGAADVMKSGYINVLLSGSTAATKGGPVYIWLAAASGSHILAGWEAAATGGSTILIPGAYFTGPADANNITEIAYNV